MYLLFRQRFTSGSSKMEEKGRELVLSVVLQLVVLCIIISGIRVYTEELVLSSLKKLSCLTKLKP
jgi:hypothetical protein